jgi:hypothetical protein
MDGYPELSIQNIPLDDDLRLDLGCECEERGGREEEGGKEGHFFPSSSYPYILPVLGWVGIALMTTGY